MKKMLASFFALALFCLLSASPACSATAEKASPSKQDVLVMKHTMLTLWDLGITEARPINPVELCRSALSFLMRGEFSTSAEFSSMYPARFANLPEKYGAFFHKKLVEKTARLVFNGWLDENALPEGVFLGAEGYYVDMEAFHKGIPANDDMWLPSYAAVESMLQQTDGTVIVNGRLRRFKSAESIHNEFLWASAPFMARFVPTEEGWQLTSFVITAETMG